MPVRLRRSLAALLFVVIPMTAQAADDQLAAACEAILRGDVQAGRSALSKALDAKPDAATTEIARINGWLGQYEKVFQDRSQLLKSTFAWNVEQAQKAAAEGKVYLALNFVTIASAYADDAKSFAAQDWVKQLAALGREEAKKWETQDQWTKAFQYYSLLGSLYEDDKEIRELREESIRHARIIVAYKDKKSLDERVQNVSPQMVREAIERVSRAYHKEPDFQQMAIGAINNLITLTNSSKLRGFLDGLANDVTRSAFDKKLRDQKQRIEAAGKLDNRGIVKLFEEIEKDNRSTVSLPTGLIVEEFIEGALGKTDEFTSMIWPADISDFNKMMEGSFFGVGISLGTDDAGTLKVVSPLENSPALEAGVEPDDLIVKVDGETTKGWTTEDAVKKITGKEGTKVKLTMRRPSSGEEFDLNLTRSKIVLKTVRGVERVPENPEQWSYMLDHDNGVAYIRLSGFHPESADELRGALDQAKAQGMKGLILDLRYNPGGLLDVAVDIVGLFVKKGKTVVSTRGRIGEEERLIVENEPKYANLPLVVLVNDNSASASEILSGALQDYNRAAILGDRTFGKGSVQRVLPMPTATNEGASRLKLTTALYYLPSGRSPHRDKVANMKDWGVDPDWVLKLTPKEARKFFERTRETEIIRKGPIREAAAKKPTIEPAAEDEEKKDDAKDDDGPPLLSPEDMKSIAADPNTAPSVDPQLEAALLQMRVKLAADLPWPRAVAAAKSQDNGKQR